MYNEDDAVAKIDGYVISVAKGVKYLGQKHLVRIDSVSRSSAAATIVGEPDDGDQPEDEETPRKRTRGRRGGRGRRSKAAAE